MSGRSKHAVLGLLADMGGNALLIVVGLMAAPIILRLTSESLYGFWVTTISVLGFLALTDIGIGISLTRLVAGMTNEQERPALNRLVSSAFFSFCAAGFVFLLAGISISAFIPVWFKIPLAEASSIIPAYQIAVFSGAIALPLSIFGAIVTGFQRMVVDNSVRSLIGIIAVGIALGLLYAGMGIIALALSMLFTVIASSMINFLYVRRLCPGLAIKIKLINRHDLLRLFTFGGYFQLSRIANTIAVSADSIIIATGKGAAMVTPYAFTSKLAVLFSINLASKVPIAVFPALSQMVALNQVKQLQRVFIFLTRYATRLAAVGAVFFILVNETFVSLWVGPQHFGGPLLNAVFVYWILQDTIYRGTTSLIYALGDIRNWAMVTFAEAGINLSISILLVGSLGLVGVALGTSIGKTLTTAWYGPYFTCKKLNLSISRFLWDGVLYTIFRCLPGMGLTVWLSYVIPINHGWVWIIIVGFATVLTNIVFFEGFEFFKPSSLPWRDRLRRLFMVDRGGL